MKLKEYLGDNNLLLAHDREDEIIGFLNFLSKSGANQGDTGRGISTGIDTIVNSWVKQQFAYKEQLTEDLITIAKTVSEVAAPILHLRNEVFRRGITIEKKFAKKCEECGKEFQNSIKKCDACESTHLREPEESQTEELKKFIKESNILGENLENILKQFHFSVNAVDDAYLYIRKEYLGTGEKDKNGKEIIRSKPIEIRHLRPSGMDYDLDTSGYPENSHWLCVFHRSEAVSDTPGKCEKCGRDLSPAMYRFKFRGKFHYFLRNEVFHKSKFFPSETTGFSPILTIFEKALSIIGMDKTVYRYFFERKIPASMLMIGTDDTDSIRRLRADVVSQLKADPEHIPIVGYSSRQNMRGKVDLVRLFHNLQEMDYMPVRTEIRERIAALWGLPPMWQSEQTGIGGLSGQSQQMTQFSRVVESDQRIFNENVFPFIMDAFGIIDWKMVVQQPEEKAESTRILFAQQRTMVATQLKSLGFKIEIKEATDTIDDIDYIISGELDQMQQQMMAGGMPNGMPGGVPQADGGQPPTGGEKVLGNAENPTTNLTDEEQNMFKSFVNKSWGEQLISKGYKVDNVNNIYNINDSIALSFISKNEEYSAIFSRNNMLLDVFKMSPLIKKNIPKKIKNNKNTELSEEEDNE